MQKSFISLQVGENNILSHHHSITQALCKVVTGERDDFIFHFDNWVKQIPGSSAKVLCPHSYSRDLLSNQELLQKGEKADASLSGVLDFKMLEQGGERGNHAWDPRLFCGLQRGQS